MERGNQDCDRRQLPGRHGQRHIRNSHPFAFLILPEYFLHYMRAAVACGLLARHSSTATIGHFTKETFEEFPVMLPPLDSQSSFASLVTRHERLQARQREAVRQTDHLFQSLLDRAFS